MGSGVSGSQQVAMNERTCRQNEKLAEIDADVAKYKANMEAETQRRISEDNKQIQIANANALAEQQKTHQMQLQSVMLGSSSNGMGKVFGIDDATKAKQVQKTW